MFQRYGDIGVDQQELSSNNYISRRVKAEGGAGLWSRRVETGVETGFDSKWGRNRSLKFEIIGETVAKVTKILSDSTPTFKTI